MPFANYSSDLIESTLPFRPALIIAIWALVFVANHFVVRALHAANARQPYMVAAARNTRARSDASLWLLARVLYAACVFTFGLYAGGAVFVFFGGGLVVGAILVLGLNVQALLSAKLLERPGACEGKLTFSLRYVYEQFAARSLGAAFASALIGLLLAHLAPLGGAMFCAAAGARYWRDAKRL